MRIISSVIGRFCRFGKSRFFLYSWSIRHMSRAYRKETNRDGHSEIPRQGIFPSSRSFLLPNMDELVFFFSDWQAENKAAAQYGKVSSASLARNYVSSSRILRGAQPVLFVFFRVSFGLVKIQLYPKSASCR